MKISKMMVPIAGACMVALSLTGCLSVPLPLGGMAGPAETSTSAASRPEPTSAPSPAKAPPRLLALDELKSLLASVRSTDGVRAAVLDDAQMQEVMASTFFGGAGMTADPAECLPILQAANLSDYRIPTAAATVGPAKRVAAVIASADDSGLFAAAMEKVDQMVGKCNSMSLAVDEQSYVLTAKNLLAPLHGIRSRSMVLTMASADGQSMSWLRMVAKQDNLYVHGMMALPDANPTDADCADLAGYINAVIDNAASLPSVDPARGTA